MFFRRKKQPEQDKTVLSQTLRSLEDLIDNPDEQAAAEAPPDALETSTTGGEHTDDRAPGSDSPTIDRTPPDTETNLGAVHTEPQPVDDSLPVLTNVVYMPIPRRFIPSATVDEPRDPPPVSPGVANVAGEIIETVSTRFGAAGPVLDAELIMELRSAVEQSLREWSIRAEAILVDHLSSNESVNQDDEASPPLD